MIRSHINVSFSLPLPFALEYILQHYHSSCQGSLKRGSGIWAHITYPSFHHTAFLPLDLCHWSVAPPKPSLMSWSSHWPPSIRSRGVICILLHSTSSFRFTGSLAVNLSSLCYLKTTAKTRNLGHYHVLFSNLKLWHVILALLYFCLYCTMVTQRTYPQGFNLGNSRNGK